MKDIFNKKIILIVALLLIIFGTFSCNNNAKKNNSLNVKKDTISALEKIRKRGKLIATTDYNSINYFVYRGTTMGYQYELLKSFAKYLGVRLKIIVNNDLNKSFKSLNKGKCDLIAIDLTITKGRNEIVDFTEPLGQTRQVLVQRKPKNWRKMKTWDEVEKKIIKNPLDLGGKTVYVQKSSSFTQRLKNLSDEIGDSINIIEDPDKDVEELITMVAKGKIDYTICDEQVALVNQKYYPDIDVGTAISFPQNIAWAVKKGNDKLRLELNKWLEKYKKTRAAAFVYNKYFKNPRYVSITKSQYNSIKGDKISPYDNIIKKESKIIPWDWRLLASLIYQESGFNPDVRSWVGAFGLMQLMPGTAKMYGVDTSSTPTENIKAGAKFIKLLNKQFKDKISDSIERTKFVLASYNVGIGHVYDARRLAKKYHKNPDIWTGNVDSFLLNKSKPKYYHDSVVYYGYCRGEEPYNFVNEILDRYNNYKNVIK